MRIRRRDRESSRSSEFAPFDQDTARASEPQGPTSLDPVKSLISEPPSIPPQDDQGLSGTLDERTPTDEVPVVDTPPPREAEAAVVDTPPQPAETAPTDTPPPASEAPSAASETAVAADPVPAAAGPQAGTVPEREPAKDVSEPLAAKEPVMRTPSISHDATELLNGSKPATRELPRVIAIANQKGGVGKTTTTVNLGAALAEQGYRVLVVDLDPQGNATTGLGVEARNFELSMYDVIMRDQPLEDCIEPTSVKNLFVAPATIDLAGVEIELVPAFSRELKLKRAIDTVVDDFDFVLIDCPPSLGLITVNGLAAADEVLVPIQCEYYALEGLSQLLRNVNLVSTNLNETLEVTTIVLTMYDARTRLSVDVANEVREHFSDRVCRVVIPRTVRLSEAPSFGQPITVFDPASRGAVAYRELAKEVSNGAPQRAR
jgi:chromosome partitioning protein